MSNVARSFFALLLLNCLQDATPRLLAQDQAIYTDSLQNGWQNYSWASVIFSTTSPVHSGSDSISVTCTNFAALYLHAPAFDSTPYTNLTFWINGGATGGQPLKVQATLNGNAQTAVILAALSTNWQQITISLAALGVADAPNLDGFWIQNNTSGNLATFYVDDITLVAGPVITNISVAIAIDANANRHVISPQIYGTAFATSNQLSDLNFTMNRSGGNNETRYNWLTNAHNLDFDYYFESYPDSSSVAGATADAFVANSKNGGAQPMITVPMIGWSPKLGAGRSILYSYAVTKYGPQTSVDQYLTNAGNGISVTNNAHITNNNPADANFATDVSFQQGYVHHLIGNWGKSTNGGIGYYLMDNEHSLWSSTHQDIHPVGPTMQEIWTKILATATMVKSNDPNVLVLGPEEWGWSGYFYSGYDQQWASQHSDYNAADFPDRSTNGGMDYMPWLLNQFHQYNTTNGQRLLDYFTLHCYPQEGDVSTEDASSGTALLRNQSTRVFWDSNYVDPSWINNTIMLIPRMHNWVSNYYPGTKIGITEYNWGAESNISGATAQADLLGIFGWQNLDLATRWTTPAVGIPAYNAMKMYRNYDGNKSTFGEASVSCLTTNPDNVSSFAAVRSVDGALTVMVINKQLIATATTTISLTNFSAGTTVQEWQLTSSNVITRLADVPVSANTISNLLPAQSITLFIVPPAVAPSPPVLVPGNLSSNNTYGLLLQGQSGQSYIIQSSSDLAHWQNIATNQLSGNSLQLSVPATNSHLQFYRALAP